MILKSLIISLCFFSSQIFAQTKNELATSTSKGKVKDSRPFWTNNVCKQYTSSGTLEIVTPRQKAKEVCPKRRDYKKVDDAYEGIDEVTDFEPLPPGVTVEKIKSCEEILFAPKSESKDITTKDCDDKTLEFEQYQVRDRIYYYETAIPMLEKKVEEYTKTKENPFENEGLTPPELLKDAQGTLEYHKTLAVTIRRIQDQRKAKHH
jgi:hypothetical protein